MMNKALIVAWAGCGISGRGFSVSLDRKIGRLRCSGKHFIDAKLG